MKYISVCLLVLLSYQAISQTFKYGSPDDLRWEEGIVTLPDGQSLKGLIQYDNKTGKLWFKDGENTLVATPREIKSFSIHNTTGSEIRNFISIEYKDPQIGLDHVYFFEILKKLKEFSILSKIDPVATERTMNPNFFSPSLSTISKNEIQIETIYIFDRGDQIEPYLKIKFTKGWGGKKEVKVVGNKVLVEKLGEHNEVVKKYAKENKLSFSDKEEFLKIMDYYDSIRQE